MRLAAFARPLEQTGRATDEAVAEVVVEEVEGYPYFIQLWGSELWAAADLAGVDRLTTGLLDETRMEIYQRLDRDFYEPRISTLTPAEQDVLIASASCPYPPIRAADLGKVSDKTPGQCERAAGQARRGRCPLPDPQRRVWIHGAEVP